MTSRWTTWRNKKRKIEEIDKLYQHHLGAIQISLDQPEASYARNGIDSGGAVMSDFPEEIVLPENRDDPVDEQKSEGDEPVDHKPTLPFKYRLAQFVSEFRLSVEAIEDTAGRRP